MVRHYVRKRPGRPCTDKALIFALLDIRGGSSYRAVSRHYGIPVAVLHRRYHDGRLSSTSGRAPRLSEALEIDIANDLALLGQYGMAFSKDSLRQFVKSHLDAHEIIIPEFKENLPGVEWANLFMKRRKNILRERVCQNTSTKLAQISRTAIEEYFHNLAEVLNGVPPECIVNYDETNIADTTGGKVQIFRRGSKNSYRVMNTSKFCTSLMYAVSASGARLKPYVVYKAQSLKTT